MILIFLLLLLKSLTKSWKMVRHTTTEIKRICQGVQKKPCFLAFIFAKCPFASNVFFARRTSFLEGATVTCLVKPSVMRTESNKSTKKERLVNKQRSPHFLLRSPTSARKEPWLQDLCNLFTVPIIKNSQKNTFFSSNKRKYYHYNELVESFNLSGHTFRFYHRSAFGFSQIRLWHWKS